MSHDSSDGFDRPLCIELRPSRRLLLAALALYLLAAALCLGPALPDLLLLPLALHLAYVHGTHIGGWLPRAVSALSWDARRGWRVRQARGGWLPAEPRLPVFVTPRLVAVRFRTAGFGHRSALVVAGRCAPDEFRRLRVRLIQSAHGDRDRAQVPGA